MEQAASLFKAFDEMLGGANVIRDVKDALSDGRAVELEGQHATSYHEALLLLGHAVRLKLSGALLETFFDHPYSDKCRGDPIPALQGRAPLSDVWVPTSWAALQEALRQVPRLDVGALVARLECERIRAEREVGQRPVEGARARKAARTEKGTVNQRMLDTIQRNHDSVYWTLREWARRLDCTPAAIHKAPAWKAVKAARAMAKAERLDRRRGERAPGER
jgi:hypothetical protein